MIKEYIKGSILDAKQKYIAHGVNCQNKMDSEVAKVLFKKYPDTKKHYHLSHEEFPKDDASFFLGSIDYGHDSEKVTILNCWTQINYGYDGKKYVSYDAIYDVFKQLCDMRIKEVAIPKIGCGLAGGNWNIVKQIIDDATGDDLDVYVYYLEDR